MAGPPSEETPPENAEELPKIRKLEDAVVNRIAAGEVIQRPASALKEMIENSLDAGATQISIMVKDGGIKMLQIQDNGHGIRESDLSLLCERHATSKLVDYSDLQVLDTLGFRGEALASISFVAHMTVTTMTRGQQHGLKVTYRDGIMDTDNGPTPCAALPGTTILVEDLFYNIPTRKKALRNTSEEYGRILDIAGRYALFKSGTGFTVKRQGEARSDLHTLPGASTLDNVRAVYGGPVASSLLPFSCQVGPEPSSVRPGDNTLSIRATGYMSNGDHAGRKTTAIFFINGRPVDCTPLRRTLEATYALTLPKAHKPWVYLDLRLPSGQVDINLHPTKSEVGFLHTDEVIDALRAAVEEKLSASNGSRTYTQALLPGAGVPMLTVDGSAAADEGGRGAAAPSSRQEVPEHKLVRTDHRSQKIHAFMSFAAPGSQLSQQQQQQQQEEEERKQEDRRLEGERGSGGLWGNSGAQEGQRCPIGEGRKVGEDDGDDERYGGDGDDGGDQQAGGEGGGKGPRSQQRAPGGGAGSVCGGGGSTAAAAAAAALGGAVSRPRGTSAKRGSAALRAEQRQVASQAPCDLDSVQQLRAEIEKDAHDGLAEILRNHTFIGLADSRTALLQHRTRMYLVQVPQLAGDMMYQLALARFQHCKRARLQPPADPGEMVADALEAGRQLGTWQGDDAAAAEVADLLPKLLAVKRDMLGEYFAIGVDEGGRVTALPQLLEQYSPDPDRLPEFLLALARDVNWEEEGNCFRTMAQALADFYGSPPLLCETEEDPASVPDHAPDKRRPPRGAGGGRESGVGGGREPQQQGAGPEPQQGGGKQGGAAAAAGREAAAGGGGGEAAGGEGEEADPDQEALADAVALKWRQWRWSVEHVLLPAMRLFLKPGRRRANDGTVVEVTRLERLYRIFERC